MIDKELEQIYDSVSALIPQLQQLLDDIDAKRDEENNSDDVITTYKIERMIEIEQDEVNKGIYVWGANGQDLNTMNNPEVWVKNREAHYSKDASVVANNVKRDMILYEKRKAKGVDPIRAFDCSGLQYYAGKAVDVFTADINSRGIYAKCTPIDKTELKRGDFVFKHDGEKIVHVALYIGNGQVIESIGRDEGVVISKLRSEFNRFGRLESLWR